MKEAIILIGMPAVGKSTLGVLLAKTLGYRFIDTDLIIQENQQQLLHQIIAVKGINAFKAIESDTLLTLTSSKSIIATGGSVIYSHEAMLHLKSIGTLIYLEATLSTINKRLNNISTRGIAMNENQTLSDLYNERTPLYSRYADYAVAIDSLTTEQSLEKILTHLDNHS